MLLVYFLQQLGLPLGSQPKNSIGSLREEQISLLRGASKRRPDGFPLAVLLKLNFILNINSIQRTPLRVGNLESARVLTPSAPTVPLTNGILRILT